MSDGITEMMRELNPLTKQEGGSHYKDMAIQPVEFITANDLGFLDRKSVV